MSTSHNYNQPSNTMRSVSGTAIHKDTSKQLNKYGVLVTVPSLSCSKCNHDYTPTLTQMIKIARGTFVKEVLSTDAACFRYTGIPSIILLITVFQWIKPVTGNIKLWDGKDKVEAGKRRGRKRRVLSLFWVSRYF